MTNPIDSSEEEKARAALREQAEEINRLDRALSEQYANDAYPVPQSGEEPPAPERLFSRKALVGWALAALVFVFIVRIVIPTAFDSAKDAIRSAMNESAHTASPPATVTIPAPVEAPTPPGAVAPVSPEAPERPEVKERPERPERKEAVERPEPGSGKTAPVTAPTVTPRAKK